MVKLITALKQNENSEQNKNFDKGGGFSGLFIGFVGKKFKREVFL